MLPESQKDTDPSGYKTLGNTSLAHRLGRNLISGVMDAVCSYTHPDIDGLENIPRSGPTLVIPNHSGVWGWDGLVLQSEILKKVHRIPHTMLHDFWFSNEYFRQLAEQLAFIPQNFRKALQILHRNDLLLLFPEAEAGNFKPSSQMYQMQPFNPGFISLAILAHACIVPCCIIGAEEAHINLGSLDWFEKWLGTKIPLPLNIIPLPVKWNLIFMEPIRLDKYERREAGKEKFLIEAAETIRLQIQQRINKELVKRKVFSFLWDG